MTGGHVKLITRGDDAGSCQSANTAILQCLRQGLLKNVSVMAPAPFFPQLADELNNLPDVCVGLHVTLNAEWDHHKWKPLLPPNKVPTLIDSDGYFLPTPAHLKNASLDQALAETQAQLILAKSAGLNVQYLDEHMRVGQVPGLRQKLYQFAEQNNLIQAEKQKPLPPLKHEPADPVERLITRLKSAPNGIYTLILHPGLIAPDMQALRHDGIPPNRVAIDRDADRQLLLSKPLKSALSRLSVEVVRYTDVD